MTGAGPTFTSEDLWALPRVGTPEPAPDGSFVVVPVTTHAGEDGAPITRLWRVDVASGARKALTSDRESSVEPAISRDGRWLAFVRRPGAPGGSAPRRGDPPRRGAGAPQLHVMDLNGGEAACVTDLPLGASLPQWHPDGRHVLFLSPVLKDAPTPEATAAALDERDASRASGRVTEDRLYRYWDRWLTDGQLHHVFAFDLETGDLVDLTPESVRWMPFMERDGHFAIAPDGRELAITLQRGEPPYDVLRWGVYTAPIGVGDGGSLQAGALRLLNQDHEGHAFRPAYSPDGRWLVYGIQHQLDFYADRQRIVACDRAAGRHVVLTEGWDVDAASEWAFRSADEVVFGAECEGRRSLYTLGVAAAVDAEDARTPRRLGRGGWHGAPRPAGDGVFATVSGLDRPPEVVRYGPDGGEPARLTSFAEDGLDRSALGSVVEWRFDGHGGRPVQCWLLFPPGTAAVVARPPDGSALPLVHLIHGGPHAAFGDQWHWRWNAQLFAARGYLVALVNFHGSTGWGEDFTSSILGRWGDQPFADVMAATDRLVEMGVVDARRMAAAGGSYGGYLVAWIASQTDRFACLVNHAGVSDFQTQYASDVTQGRARSMGGEPWDQIEGMDRYNPLRHAAGFRSPMLVIHGERDYRVPHDQGLAIYGVYKAMGLPARLLSYPDENHWILKRDNSLQWYGEVLGWIDRWLDAGA